LRNVTTEQHSTVAFRNTFYEIETHKKLDVTLNQKELIVYGGDGKINAQVQLSDIKAAEVRTGTQCTQLCLQLQDNSYKSWYILFCVRDYWKRVFYTSMHRSLEVTFKLVLENSLSNKEANQKSQKTAMEYLRNAVATSTASQKFECSK
jgi:hypothetical protein